MEISLTTPTTRTSLLLWWKQSHSRLSTFWRTKHKRRSLVIQETAALGERRFVAVLQFEGQRFLIGGSANAVTLLAHLPQQPAGDQPAR